MGKVSVHVVLCFVQGKSLKWKSFRRLQDSHLADSYCMCVNVYGYGPKNRPLEPKNDFSTKLKTCASSFHCDLATQSADLCDFKRFSALPFPTISMQIAIYLRTPKKWNTNECTVHRKEIVDLVSSQNAKGERTQERKGKKGQHKATKSKYMKQTVSLKKRSNSVNVQYTVWLSDNHNRDCQLASPIFPIREHRKTRRGLGLGLGEASRGKPASPIVIVASYRSRKPKCKTFYAQREIFTAFDFAVRNYWRPSRNYIGFRISAGREAAFFTI